MLQQVDSCNPCSSYLIFENYWSFPLYRLAKNFFENDSFNSTDRYFRSLLRVKINLTVLLQFFLEGLK